MSIERHQLPGVVVTSLATTQSREVDMDRGSDGQWRYRNTPVLVPGATDIPLSDRVEAFEVSRPGENAVAVMVSASAVEADPDLAFVQEIGRLLRGQQRSDDVYVVDRSLWDEHTAQAVAAGAPEQGPAGLRQRLALDERATRFARWELEQRTAQRSRTLAIVSALGMTRREAGEILGVTGGRVQQLIDDLRPQLRVEVDDLLADIVQVLRAIGQSRVTVKQIELPAGRSLELLEEMEALGLIVRDSDVVTVTEAGDKAELHLRMQRRSRRDGP